MRGRLVPVLALKFALELVAFFGCAVLGWQLAPGSVLGWILAALLPASVIAVWSLLIAPRSVHILPVGPRVIAQLVVFAVAAAGFWLAGWAPAAAVFSTAVIVVEVVLLSTRSYGNGSARP